MAIYLGLVTIKDVMLVPYCHFWLARSAFHIPRGYTFIWYKLQKLWSSYEPIPDLDGGAQELDWTFVGSRDLSMISTNDAYYKLMEERVIRPLLGDFILLYNQGRLVFSIDATS